MKLKIKENLHLISLKNRVFFSKQLRKLEKYAQS